MVPSWGASMGNSKRMNIQIGELKIKWILSRLERDSTGSGWKRKKRQSVFAKGGISHEWKRWWISPLNLDLRGRRRGDTFRWFQTFIDEGYMLGIKKIYEIVHGKGKWNSGRDLTRNFLKILSQVRHMVRWEHADRGWGQAWRFRKDWNETV